MKFDQTYYQMMVTKSLTELLMEHRAMTEIEALETFINSETYRMVCDPELKMWELAPLAIFDLWENEIATGDPRNSLYIRGDEI